MKALDILKKVREILTPPRAWRQGAYVADDNGRYSVDAEGSRATCFCAFGAMLQARARLPGLDRDYVALYGAEDCLMAEIEARYPSTYTSIPAWNDDEDLTHAEVLDTFDRAIERAQREDNTP